MCILGGEGAARGGKVWVVIEEIMLHLVGLGEEEEGCEVEEVGTGTKSDQLVHQ